MLDCIVQGLLIIDIKNTTFIPCIIRNYDMFTGEMRGKTKVKLC